MSFEDAMRAAEGQLLFDPIFIDPSVPTGLWICENAYEVQAVQINAFCLPTGGSWDNLNRCTEFLQSFCYLLVVCADPKRRKDMVEQVQSRVAYMPVLVAEDKSFRGCKTVAELRAQHGLKSINEILLYTKELPAYGLLNLADVKTPDVSKLPKVYSGISEMDVRTGGFLMGLLSVWTGKRGLGKSTILGQMMLEAIDQGEVVCAYSGELMAWQFKNWLSLQAAGPKHIRFVTDQRTGQKLPTIPDTVQSLIDSWWDNRFLLDDIGKTSAHDGDRILSLFEYAHRRYGASVFLLDNIMTAKLKMGRERDFYRAQSDFVGRLAEFAKRTGSHVHVVAHPRKTDKGQKYLENDDVGGIGDITNMADYVFSIDQVASDDATEVDADGREVKAYDTHLSILKNRPFGNKGTMKMEFDRVSRRFYRPGKKPEERRFGWDHAGHQLSLEDIPPDTYDPFK